MKHKTRHCQGENSSIFIHKICQEKFVKRKILNLHEKRSRRKYSKNFDKNILMRI